MAAFLAHTRTTTSRYREHIGAARGRIEAKLRAARADKQALDANCLTDKLVQVKAHAKLVEADSQALERAGAGGAAAPAREALERVNVRYKNIGLILVEAEGCTSGDYLLRP
jgi:hypothetical protein